MYWYLIMILKFIFLMTEAEQLLNGLWASWKFSLVPEYIFSPFFYWAVIFFIYKGILYILWMSLFWDINYEHHLLLSDLPFIF